MYKKSITLSIILLREKKTLPNRQTRNKNEKIVAMQRLLLGLFNLKKVAKLQTSAMQKHLFQRGSEHQ